MKILKKMLVLGMLAGSLLMSCNSSYPHHQHKYSKGYKKSLHRAHSSTGDPYFPRRLKKEI